MYRPASLKSGDTIGLVCPARKISIDEVQTAVQWIENNGFKVLIGESVGAEYHQYAGDDALRRKDFQKMMDHTEVKAILACRGGYGTVRILDDLHYGNFINKPKWICGYSDITALHSHLNHVMGIATLHCTMPINFSGNSTEALVSMLNALKGIERSIEWEAHPLNIAGTMQGEIIGGNLSILYSLLGTKTGLLTSGKILFLEDLDEYLYHIDRMMMALKRAGKLQGLNGIVVGGMTDMKDNAIPYGKNAEEIIHEHCAKLGIPLVFNFPAGHIADNRALMFGIDATINVGEQYCTFVQR